VNIEKQDPLFMLLLVQAAYNHLGVSVPGLVPPVVGLGRHFRHHGQLIPGFIIHVEQEGPKCIQYFLGKRALKVRDGPNAQPKFNPLAHLPAHIGSFPVESTVVVEQMLQEHLGMEAIPADGGMLCPRT
jgi:hypothetical protein